MESARKIRELKERKRATEDMLSKLREETSRSERERRELEESVRGMEEKALEIRRNKD